MMFDRNILRCARVTACPNCERRGVMPPSNMTRNDLDVFKCDVCGMEIDLNKLEECQR